MWNLRSPCYRTDLFIAAFDGVVEEHDTFVVVRTPKNPDAYWGNFLLFRDPPDASSFGAGADSWPEQFRRFFPNAAFELYGWDRPDGALGDTSAATARGYVVDPTVVLGAQSVVVPARFDASIVVDPIHDDADADWNGAALALTNAFAPRRSGTLDALKLFMDRQIARYRAMQRKGIGQWFVARVDGTIAATLGVVRCEELGRFQLVGTDPRFGRRGVCSSLVYGAARYALDEMKVRSLVMAADDTYYAARVYESVGFARAESLMALVRKPPRE